MASVTAEPNTPLKTIWMKRKWSSPAPVRASRPRSAARHPFWCENRRSPDALTPWTMIAAYQKPISLSGHSLCTLARVLLHHVPELCRDADARLYLNTSVRDGSRVWIHRRMSWLAPRGLRWAVIECREGRGGREKETTFHHAGLARQQLLPTAAQRPQLKGTGTAETPRTFPYWGKVAHFKLFIGCNCAKKKWINSS